MKETNKPSSTHADELRRLGFPEPVVLETERAEKRGLFRFEPSPDLVKRTIARCQGLLQRDVRPDRGVAAQPVTGDTKTGARPSLKEGARSKQELGSAITELVDDVFEYQKVRARLSTSLDDVSVAVGKEGSLAEFTRFNRLPVDCLATVDFARSKRQPPLMLVDNHNLFDPNWWDFDSGFLAIRRAFRVVNTVARESHLPPIVVVMVLRQNIKEYTNTDIDAIRKVLDTASSDVWICPYELADEYKKQDLIVLGGDRVLQLEEKVSSPGQALGAFREIEDTSLADTHRKRIERVTNRATQVRGMVGKAPEIESIASMRALIEKVDAEGMASR
jgi:hypothetical protein